MSHNKLFMDRALFAQNAVLVAEANELYARINGAWTKIAEYISRLGVLKPCETGVVDADLYNLYALGIGKHNGSWDIYVVTVKPGMSKWVRVVESRVEHRTNFLKHVPALLEALVVSNREAVETMRDALADLQKSGGNL